MKFLSTLAAVAALLAGVEAGIKGVNIGANNEDGSCKTTAQWETAFKKIRALPNKYRAARLFAASDCGTLAQAVPAAKKTGTKLLVGVWATDQSHYEAEKAALRSAIQQFGSGWILAVSVGSEDLYRKDHDPASLAGQIHEVKGILRELKVKKKVTHVDTWTAWVDHANDAVIKAVDFVSMDAYPYFQNAAIDASKDVFFKALDDTRNSVHSVSPGKKIWITESGQPWKGADSGASHPSKGNARKYFKDVFCTLYKQGVPAFLYSYQDYNANPSFGIFGRNGKPVYDTKC